MRKKEKKTYDEISKATGIKKASIQSILRTPILKRRKGIATKPSALKRAEKLRIKLLVSRDPSVSIREIQRELKTTASVSTIARYLKKLEFIKQLYRIRPKLKVSHIQARLDFAELNVDRGDRWLRVIFSDEKKFSLNGPDGKMKFWRRKRCVLPKTVFSVDTHAFRGIMVWLGVSSKGILHIERIQGKITAETYSKLIIDKALPKFRRAHGEDFEFQQDNATPHVAKKTLEAFAEAKIKLFPWPALSPDVSPVENLWAMISEIVYKKVASYPDENSLWDAVQSACKKIPRKKILDLITGMKKRCIMLISKQGKYIQ